MSFRVGKARQGAILPAAPALGRIAGGSTADFRSLRIAARLWMCAWKILLQNRLIQYFQFTAVRNI
ncbi:hypothetical protein BN2497_10209 [Janthinobacterium sp. CG23_2]|nr:hypothetical protein BN2497_10209 [Janthinobacterium sp. CG23_2]CUU31502.1 hypothetical protein BN3177_10209 [Janthinobacterium sp. CG23_2]